ncbi:MAG: DUF3552 domain-containing protein [Chloroflexi bacterium]|nr:DUF3552 domain-containing protein [Chloroflexota bacterium]
MAEVLKFLKEAYEALRGIPPERLPLVLSCAVVLAITFSTGYKYGMDTKEAEMQKIIDLSILAHAQEVNSYKAQIEKESKNHQSEVAAYNTQIETRNIQLKAQQDKIDAQKRELDGKDSDLKTKLSDIKTLQDHVTQLEERIAVSQTQASTAPVLHNCEPEIQAVITRANLAQKAYWLKQITNDEFDKAWGGAAQTAKDEAMELERAVDSFSGKITDIIDPMYKYCLVIRKIGANKLLVETTEHWEITAMLNCGTKQTFRKLLADYEHQLYRVLQDSEGWRLEKWVPGDENASERWTCRGT